jgi:plasmid stabilization system protein ParE
MYNIITTKKFWDDLEEIALDLEDFSGIPDGADRLLLEIERLSPGLREYPRRYRRHIPSPRYIPDDEYRVMAAKGYYIFYVVLEERKEIELRRVISHYKDVDRWLFDSP